jgi:hypothetical protein
MKQNTNNLGTLMGSYHQSPSVPPTAKKNTPSVGDTTVVERWNAERGRWDSVLLVWDGNAYVTK